MLGEGSCSLGTHSPSAARRPAGPLAKAALEPMPIRAPR